MTRERALALVTFFETWRDAEVESIAESIAGANDESNAEWLANAKARDVDLGHATDAIAVLRERYLKPRPTPHFTPDPDPRLPGFD